jgi:hypothetical protein
LDPELFKFALDGSLPELVYSSVEIIQLATVELAIMDGFF